MSKKVDKLCVFCVHFHLNTGDIDTFNESCGDMYCSKDHFGSEQWNRFDSDDKLRSVIFMAETCKDYEQVKI